MRVGIHAKSGVFGTKRPVLARALSIIGSNRIARLGGADSGDPEAPEAAVDKAPKRDWGAGQQGHPSRPHLDYLASGAPPSWDKGPIPVTAGDAHRGRRLRTSAAPRDLAEPAGATLKPSGPPRRPVHAAKAESGNRGRFPAHARLPSAPPAINVQSATNVRLSYAQSHGRRSTRAVACFSRWSLESSTCPFARPARARCETCSVRPPGGAGAQRALTRQGHGCRAPARTQ